MDGDGGIDPSAVYVEPLPGLGGALKFQSESPAFAALEQRYLDFYATLRRRERIADLKRECETLGLRFEWVGDAEDIAATLLWAASVPFECDSPWFVGRRLFDFQRFGLNLAQVLPRLLLQWDTGAGKTVGAALTAQRLLEDGRIDAFVFIVGKRKKADWERFLGAATALSAQRIDGTRQKRHTAILGPWRAIVVNWESARYPTHRRGRPDWGRTDLRQLTEAVRGRRVLIVLDEAQRIGNSETKTSLGIQHLIAAAGSARVLALSATPYTREPENVFNLLAGIAPGALGTKDEFWREYVAEWKLNGSVVVPRWDESKLPLLGKRIEHLVHVATKSDPDIADQFPTMVERQVLIRASPEDLRLYREIQAEAQAVYGKNGTAANRANLQLLRMTLCTAESLIHSGSPLAARILSRRAREGLPPPTSATSEKFARAVELLESVFLQGEKAVVFTFWADLVLEPFLRFLMGNTRGSAVPVVPGGIGQTALPIDRNGMRKDYAGSIGAPTSGGLTSGIPSRAHAMGAPCVPQVLPRGAPQSVLPEAEALRESLSSSRAEQLQVRHKALLKDEPMSVPGGADNGGNNLSTWSRVYTFRGGLSEEEGQAVLDAFDADPGPAVLVSSDAGREGLNVYAPYLVHLEVPYTYAAYKQRRDRIHRIDSRAHGIERVWVYRFLTEGTVEEAIDRLVERRRRQAEAIQGSSDVVVERDTLDAAELRALIVGTG